MGAPILTSTGIRTDLVARLVGKTAAGSRVFNSRRVDVETDEIPAVVVTSLGGDGEKWSKNSLIYKRAERVQVTGIVTGTDDANLAATLDTMEAAIADALLSDPEWLGAFETIDKIAVEKSLDVDARKRIGGVAVTFELGYSVTYAVNLTGADLEEVAVTTDTTEPAGADVSTRVIPIEVAP